MADLHLLEKLPSQRFVVAAWVLSTTTILVSYGFAVGLGHVPAPPAIPMISDCAVQAPERYIFRIGIITVAWMDFLVTVLMFSLLRLLRGTARSDYAMLTLSFIASLCLAGVGAINEKEDNPVHTTCAIVFFFCSLLYMVMVMADLISLWRAGNHRISKKSVAVKCVLCVVGTADFAGFGVGTLLGSETVQAICEWCGVILIQFFMFSCQLDFKTDLFYGTLIDKAATPSAYDAHTGASNVNLKRRAAARPVVHVPELTGAGAATRKAVA